MRGAVRPRPVCALAGGPLAGARSGQQRRRPRRPTRRRRPRTASAHAGLARRRRCRRPRRRRRRLHAPRDARSGRAHRPRRGHDHLAQHERAARAASCGCTSTSTPSRTSARPSSASASAAAAAAARGLGRHRRAQARARGRRRRADGGPLAGRRASPPRRRRRDRRARRRCPRDVAPGEAITLDVAFDDKLPSSSSAPATADSFHMVGQWFPKVARLEPDGTWAHFPFHHLAEFYADFGTYDVTLDVPEAYVDRRHRPGRRGARRGRAPRRAPRAGRRPRLRLDGVGRLAERRARPSTAST